MDSRLEKVHQAISLAGRFYQMQGYIHREGFKYWNSPHPQEQLMFHMACEAFEFIEATPIMDIVNELEDEGLL